jgi:hypothetical protein
MPNSSTSFGTQLKQSTAQPITSNNLNYLREHHSPEHCSVLVLPVPCVVLPAAHLLQRSAALLLSAAKPALKWPLGHLVTLVEPAAERCRPAGTTAHSSSNASRHAVSALQEVIAKAQREAAW